MKLNDVANQLRLLLPQYSTLFSDYLTPTSMTADGATLTINFGSAHGLSTGAFLILNSVARKTPIVGFTKEGAFNFTFETGSNHDLTENWYRNPNDRLTANQVELGGFTDPLWNGVKDLSAAPNRKHFLVKSAVANPTLNGSEYLLEIEAAGVNGSQQVTVTSPTQVTIAGAFAAGAYLGGTVSKMPRINVCLTEKDAWSRVITPLNSGQFAVVVLPIDVVTSKDRNTYNDGVAARTNGVDFRLTLLDGFVLLIVAPTHQQLTGAAALDICKHDLRRAIYSCLLGLTPSTGTASSGDYRVVPMSDGVAMYDGSKLIYQYIFQYPMDLTSDDTVPPPRTAAFRNVEYNLDVGDGMNTNVDLDDVPLDSN